MPHGASLRDTEYASRVLLSLQHSSPRCTSHGASPYNTEYTPRALPSFYVTHYYNAHHTTRRCTTQNTLHAYSLHTSCHITTTSSISCPHFIVQSTILQFKPNTSQLHFASQLRSELHNY
ncbi:hypothetical protein I3843_09G196500 [Carya illinoinensis]|uniref:Uncharacterized protein n=1 Tax=Carya illinoinensis TaxID=32201 RepID=A0A922E633_CARIL|nr:hypothetical protein I3842_09G202500 [Carya illinoinensis]KAG7964917.1 hypothetical protein I3843_09G196500 [Carya illinoinensis]